YVSLHLLFLTYIIIYKPLLLLAYYLFFKLQCLLARTILNLNHFNSSYNAFFSTK
ncbi:unnamed protein product, partial [Prunus brigantina]